MTGLNLDRFMSRRLVAGLLIAPLVALGLVACAGAPQTAQKGGKVHRVAIHVDDNDPARMNLALNNIVNVTTDYAAMGEEVEVELVAYGPGLHMLREDTSPVKARLKSISESVPGVSFSACMNTVENMKKAEGKEIPLVAQSKRVKAGVIRLIELQEQGWSYIKP